MNQKEPSSQKGGQKGEGGETLNAAAQAAADQQREYTREKEYLERSIEGLKRKIKKDGESHRLGSQRIMSENVELLREINDLKRELASLRGENALEALSALQATERGAVGAGGGGAGEEAGMNAGVTAQEVPTGDGSDQADPGAVAAPAAAAAAPAAAPPADAGPAGPQLQIAGGDT